MLKRLLVFVFSACVVLSCVTAKAQNLCPVGVQSEKLVCLMPQLFGVNGLVLASTTPTGHFQDNFLGSSLQPLSSAISRQAALIPLASPSSGFTFSFDPETKTFIRSTDSFGPIFGERAQTIGKYHVYLGFDYQYLQFNKIDGVSLKSLPVVFTQQDDNVDAPPDICSINAPANNTKSTGNCSFIRDVITTVNRVDLKIHQFTTYFTFGVTDRIDVSLAIPIENVRMAVFSNATIVRNEDPSNFDHVFPTRTGCLAPCLQAPFSNIGTASGIGDMTLRVKGIVWTHASQTAEGADTEVVKNKQDNQNALALGVDIRMPTGDQLNFLGAGAAGVRPFVVWSYGSRISPHTFIGYEVNGSSVIGGDISTNTKDRLPGQLTYSSGVDAWVTKRVTAAFDVVGQQVFQARRTVSSTFTEPGACVNTTPPCTNLTLAQPKVDPNLAQLTGTFNITNASLGVKVKAASTLLITGNVLLKLNQGGLRSTAAPLLGLSYTF